MVSDAESPLVAASTKVSPSICVNSRVATVSTARPSLINFNSDELLAAFTKTCTASPKPGERGYGAQL